jgi:SH3-like domain-containing protein
MNKYILLLIFSLHAEALHAEEPQLITGKETGLPIPRFVILKSNKTNLRVGPGIKYQTSWTYLRKGYPMQVVAEFENWRKLRDIDGSEGWVNENLITGKRSAIITGNQFSKPLSYQLKEKEMVLLRYPREDAPPTLKVEFGVIAEIKKCNELWCKLKIQNKMGWIKKENTWGVFSDEIFG